MYFCGIYTSLAQQTITGQTLISRESEIFIAQSDSIDQIENLILDTFKSKSKKDTLLGLAYCNSYLNRGEREQNLGIQYFSNYQIGYISFHRTQHKKSLQYAYASAKNAEKMKDTANLIKSKVLLGGNWYVMGVYDQAIKPFLSAKELASATQNEPYELVSLANIANIRTKLNRFRDALNTHNTVLAILDKKKDQEEIFEPYIPTYLSVLLGKIVCLSELDKFQEAIETSELGIEMAKKDTSGTYKGYFNINLGRVYYEKGEYHTSLGFLRQGKEMLKSAGLQNNMFITDFYIAKNLVELGQHEEAIVLLDSIFESIGDDIETDRIEEMYQLAIDISKIQNNKEKLIAYYDKLQTITEIKNANKLTAKDLLYEDDLKEYELENEKLANKNTQSLVDKRIILAISIIVVLVLIAIFISYYRKAKIKEQTFLAIIEDISKKTTEEKPQKAVQNSSIKDAKVKAILDELETLENTHFYLSPDVTLHTTAKLLNTNTTYLSKAVNAGKKQSFNQYLNKLRIEYVLIKLKEDALFRSYTIHAISKEIGYKSATTFIKEFKNKTGLNPSYYIKKIAQ
jgi:YesN/AraC family two-component response regulator